MFYVDGRLESEKGDRLHRVIGSVRTARDRHEQNLELIRDGSPSASSPSSSSPSSSFCVRTLRPIRRGQPFRIWYGEALARELGVPILTPANIRGHQEYSCTKCHSIFAQPNVLKAHLFFECNQPAHQQAAQPSALVPFHAILENISCTARLLVPKARTTSSTIRKTPTTTTTTLLHSPSKQRRQRDVGSRAGIKPEPVVGHSDRLSSRHFSSSLENGRKSPKTPTPNTTISGFGESTQNSELSPSLSSSSSLSSSPLSSDTSFEEHDDEEEEEEEDVEKARRIYRYRAEQRLRRQELCGTDRENNKSAFQRPAMSAKRSSGQAEDVAMMTPDSSTDQRMALNLSVKTEQLLSLSTDDPRLLAHHHHHHHHPNLGHYPWSILHTAAGVTTTARPQTLGIPYSLNRRGGGGTLPVFYSVNPANPMAMASLGVNYLDFNNQQQHNHHHQAPRMFNIGGRHRVDPGVQLQMQNPDLSSLHQPQPQIISPNKRGGQAMPQTMSFSSPGGNNNCLPTDATSSPPLNPYGLDLPSDKEPLDLLPQTYFTNKSKRGHLCLYCGKLYSRKYGLKIHMRTHNGYKPLKCKICSRPFGDPSNLNKHVRLHAQGETPYRCEYCGKVLVRRRDLERHVRSRHPMGRFPVETSPPSSPISVDDIDTSSPQDNTTSL